MVTKLLIAGLALADEGSCSSNVSEEIVLIIDASSSTKGNSQMRAVKAYYDSYVNAYRQHGGELKFGALQYKKETRHLTDKKLVPVDTAANSNGSSTFIADLENKMKEIANEEGLSTTDKGSMVGSALKHCKNMLIDKSNPNKNKTRKKCVVFTDGQISDCRGMEMFDRVVNKNGKADQYWDYCENPGGLTGPEGTTFKIACEALRSYRTMLKYCREGFIDNDIEIETVYVKDTAISPRDRMFLMSLSGCDVGGKTWEGNFQKTGTLPFIHESTDCPALKLFYNNKTANDPKIPTDDLFGWLAAHPTAFPTDRRACDEQRLRVTAVNNENNDDRSFTLKHDTSEIVLHYKSGFNIFLRFNSSRVVLKTKSPTDTTFAPRVSTLDDSSLRIVFAGNFTANTTYELWYKNDDESNPTYYKKSDWPPAYAPDDAWVKHPNQDKVTIAREEGKDGQGPMTMTFVTIPKCDTATDGGRCVCQSTSHVLLKDTCESADQCLKDSDDRLCSAVCVVGGKKNAQNSRRVFSVEGEARKKIVLKYAGGSMKHCEDDAQCPSNNWGWYLKKSFGSNHQRYRNRVVLVNNATNQIVGHLVTVTGTSDELVFEGNFKVGNYEVWNRNDWNEHLGSTTSSKPDNGRSGKTCMAISMGADVCVDKSQKDKQRQKFNVPEPTTKIVFHFNINAHKKCAASLPSKKCPRASPDWTNMIIRDSKGNQTTGEPAPQADGHELVFSGDFQPGDYTAEYSGSNANDDGPTCSEVTTQDPNAKIACTKKTKPESGTDINTTTTRSLGAELEL